MTTHEIAANVVALILVGFGFWLGYMAGHVKGIAWAVKLQSWRKGEGGGDE